MRILAAGDFHQEDVLRDRFIEEANSGGYDLAIAIGDYEDPDFYQALPEQVETQFLAVTGNWDFGFEPPDNDEYERLFNYQEVNFDDLKIALLGAVYPDDFMDQIHEFFQGTDNAKRIVASHYPPHMLGDLARTGTRAGFPQFRDLIMREKPTLWLCGHIHEDFGEFSLMDTTVLNAASKESGKGWQIELGDDGVEDVNEVLLDER